MGSLLTPETNNRLFFIFSSGIIFVFWNGNQMKGFIIADLLVLLSQWGATQHCQPILYWGFYCGPFLSSYIDLGPPSLSLAWSPFWYSGHLWPWGERGGVKCIFFSKQKCHMCISNGIHYYIRLSITMILFSLLSNKKCAPGKYEDSKWNLIHFIINAIIDLTRILWTIKNSTKLITIMVLSSWIEPVLWFLGHNKSQNQSS